MTTFISKGNVKENFWIFYLSTYQSIYLSLLIPISLSMYLFIYISMYPFIYISMCLLSIYLSTYLFATLCIYLSIYISMSIFLCLYLSLSPTCETMSIWRNFWEAIILSHTLENQIYILFSYFRDLLFCLTNFATFEKLYPSRQKPSPHK